MKSISQGCSRLRERLGEQVLKDAGDVHTFVGGERMGGGKLEGGMVGGGGWKVEGPRMRKSERERERKIDSTDR